MKPVRRFATVAILAGSALATNSCNIYSPIAGPSGDQQLLSAARACLDRGDLTCAQDNYGKLSGSYADIKNSETAYGLLDAQNAGMTGFSSFVGEIVKSGDAGAAVTAYANQLSSVGTPGETSRVAIQQAYVMGSNISGNPSLKAFVQFTSSLALVSEILSEASGAGNTLKLNDLATSGAACKAQTGPACGIGPGYGGCAAPGNNLTDGTGAVISLTTAGTMAGVKPSTDQLMAAIKGAYDSISQLNPSSDFAKAGAAFNTIYTQLGNQAPCVREALLQQGIGK